MSRITRIAKPPVRAVMVWDGDCSFCGFWVRKLERRTGESVEYLAYQSPRVTEMAPEIPRAQFEEAVQLILPDGRVLSGADSIFAVLAEYGNMRWPGFVFERVPGAAPIAKLGYRLIASHRKFFSWLTRLVWRGQK